MNEARNFQCPNCGSPLTVQGAQAEIKCPYCGSTVIVPEELRPKAAPVSFRTPTPMFFPQTDDQISKEISTVGKVAAGIALSSMIAPIVITLAVFCVVGVFLAFLFWGINSTFQSASQVANPHALQTSLVGTLLPALTEIPTEIPATEAPTAAPTPIVVSTPFSKVLLRDNFSNKKSGWDEFSDSDYTLAYVKGGYRIFIDSRDGGQTSWLDKSYKNINVEVDVKYVAGPDDGNFGVTCRAKEDVGFYSFEFRPDGTYSIEKYTSETGQSVSETLAEGSLDTSSFSKDAVFHLRGDCVGETLTLYLNGDALLQVSDAGFKSGGVGLIARTGPSGDPGVDALFSNYSVKGQ